VHGGQTRLQACGASTIHASLPSATRPDPPARPADSPAAGRRIALLVPNLAGGGAETCMLRTADELLKRGYEVDLVLCERSGPLLAEVPAAARVLALSPAPMLMARAFALAADPAGVRAMLAPILLAWRPHQRLPHLPALVRYLRRERPDALFSAMPMPNLMAVWARRLAKLPVRVVVSERNTLSAMIDGSPRWRERHLPRLLGHGYRMADAIVAVSDGVADDLTSHAGLPREGITTVYNPVITTELAPLARQPLVHPWFQPAPPPVILGVGSLAARKDFPTLLRAFARVRAQRECRLVILGQGSTPEKTAEVKAELTALATSLGVGADVDLPGFVANPFAYMARAGAFVLSSSYEGLPGVLIQALACGCPVVSTDCPSGPAEILDGGRFGALVPVGDDQALAAAIAATLADPIAAERLRARGAMFSVERAVDRYLELMFESTAGLGADGTGSP
jgi:glycosyltransferase involved in cell wall biosynthesis